MTVITICYCELMVSFIFLKVSPGRETEYESLSSFYREESEMQAVCDLAVVTLLLTGKSEPRSHFLIFLQGLSRRDE